MAPVDARIEHEHVAVLSLNDPPANAYSHEMLRALDDAILGARFDPVVDVIALARTLCRPNRAALAGFSAFLARRTPTFKGCGRAGPVPGLYKTFPRRASWAIRPGDARAAPLGGSMARFLSWLGEVVCGLAAYTLSRWLWQKQGDGVFANLWQELATFSVLFILLRLIFKGMELAR